MTDGWGPEWQTCKGLLEGRGLAIPNENDASEGPAMSPKCIQWPWTGAVVDRRMSPPQRCPHFNPCILIAKRTL